jgi:hypothetical protein
LHIALGLTLCLAYPMPTNLKSSVDKSSLLAVDAVEGILGNVRVTGARCVPVLEVPIALDKLRSLECPRLPTAEVFAGGEMFLNCAATRRDSLT